MVSIVLEIVIGPKGQISTPLPNSPGDLGVTKFTGGVRILHAAAASAVAAAASYSYIYSAVAAAASAVAAAHV